MKLGELFKNAKERNEFKKLLAERGIFPSDSDDMSSIMKNATEPKARLRAMCYRSGGIRK